MSPERLREILALLHWSQRSLAIPLDCSERLPRAWAQGRETIPPIVAEWLEALAAAHEAHPPPADWRRPRFGRVA
jgi:hypothetical protein